MAYDTRHEGNVSVTLKVLAHTGKPAVASLALLHSIPPEEGVMCIQ